MRSSQTRVILISFLLFAFCYAELVQLQIVHRHGARTHLSKQADYPGLENGATLLPVGVTQLRKLGEIVRRRYLQPSSNTTIRNSQLNFTSPLDVLSISTNLDRTLSSARAFLVGLYPNQHELIPTKTFGAKENDYRLRGYAICPTFDASIREFNREMAHMNDYSETQQLINRIAPLVNEQPTYKNLFNIYDKYKLTQLGYPTPPGTKPLSSNDWRQLKLVADKNEALKFNLHIPIKVANPLYATLLDYSKQMAENYNHPKPASHRIIEYSTHYPTILLLLTAMRDFAPRPPSPGNAIPPFGAALLWETHRDTDGSFSIRTLWYNGDSKPPQLASILPCTKCTISELIRSLRNNFSTKPRPFCTVCRTNPRTSPICAKDALPSHISDNKQAKSESKVRTTCNRARVSAGIIGAVLGIVLGLLTWALFQCIGMWRLRRWRRQVARMNVTETDADDSPDPGWSGTNKGASSGSSGPSVE